MERSFLDSSALLRRIFLEGDFAVVDELIGAGASTSTLSEVEVGVGIQRRCRAGLLTTEGADGLLRVGLDLFDRLARVDLTPAVREEAVRLARLHALRSLDAIQLATAAVQGRIDRRHGHRVRFCTADLRQAEASRQVLGVAQTLLLDPL